MFKKYMPTKLFFLALVLAGTTGFLSAQTVFVTVNVNQAPALVADAGQDQDVCDGETVQIGGNPAASGGTSSYSYAWAPNSSLSSGTIGNPNATPTGSTSYILEVTDANNCTSFDTVLVNVNPLPTPIFSASVASNGLDVTFSDMTSGNNTAWNWDFGDGFLSNLQNPTHSYTSNGTYTVCLTVTSADGCADSTCQVVNAIVGLEDALIGGFSVAPNPFHEATQVSFTLNQIETVQLEAFDMLGQRVAVLESGEMTSGTHKYRFSAQELGHPAGVYFLRLTVGEKHSTLKVVEVE